MKYIEIDGGNKLLLDLGGYGLVIKVDENNEWYDVRYVIVEYRNGMAVPRPIPAEMEVFKGRGKKMTEQADMVRIWRHGIGPEEY
jgi:hypothetical protein